MLNLHFDNDGLIPVVVQEDQTREVLLVAFMNEAALQRTLETGLAHFWSRSRGKLWLKGETSGQVQEVVGLYVNCEENSLLLRVQLRGVAACHEGYHSCYYRKLNEQGAWEVMAPRLFDPAEVYREGGVPPVFQPAGAGPLAQALQRIYRAYEYLRDHDLEAVSGTSRRLRIPDLAWLRQRAAEELTELAGVLAGTHTHTNQAEDTILEGRQVCYWLLLLAAAVRLPYVAFSPHEALRQGYETGDTLDDAALTGFPKQSLLTIINAGLRLVGGACHQLGIPLLTLAERELAELQEKSYLKDVVAP
jgi:phosphoribosyl-AMP cyclohydrolase